MKATRRARASYVPAFVLTLGLCTIAFALPSGQVAASAAMQEDDSVTLTGCVQKGSGEDEIVLATADGKTYLLSGEVNVAAHVGHTVTVTGTVADAEEGDAVSGHVTVSTVTMVKDSCDE